MGKLLSQGEYLRNDGAVCPWCQSDNLIGTELTTKGNEMRHTIRCNDCGERWDDIYTLTGFILPNQN